MVTGRDALIYFYIKYNGDQRKIGEAINKHEKLKATEVAKVLETVDTKKYITMLDDDYPEKYRQSVDQPYVVERGISKKVWDKFLADFKDELWKHGR